MSITAGPPAWVTIAIRLPLSSLCIKIDATEVNLALLVEKGIASKKADALRVLGNGELKKAITVTARHFTASAKEKIEAAGGSVKVD